MKLRAPRPHIMARVLAFFLTHFCDSVTLMKIERAIIEEVTSRIHTAQDGKPSPRQWIPSLIACWRKWRKIERATAHLHETVKSWVSNDHQHEKPAKNQSAP